MSHSDSSVSPKPSWLALGGCLLATFATSAVGGLVTAGSVKTWYPTLVKPSWNPPSWVFAPVWTALFAAMAVAAWRVWPRRAEPLVRSTLAAFFVHLVFNAGWSALFFGLRRPDLALVEIVVLWGLLVWLQRRFLALDRVAAYLWMPYVAWVSFATVLNGAIVWLNR